MTDAPTHMCACMGLRVWIDVARILAAPACWVDCMKLVPDVLSDPPNGCKLRPGEGMTSIGELDPGAEKASSPAAALCHLISGFGWYNQAS